MAKRSVKTSKLRKQIETTFEKTLERTFEKAMHLPQVERAKTKAKRAATGAKRVKETLDQALLDLQHKAVDLKSRPEDLIQKVGQRVLERAERIRQQVAETPYSPGWLKDFSLTPRGQEAAEAGEAEESKEDSPEELATGAVVDMKRAKVTLATTASEATESEAAAGMEPESYSTATKAGKPAKLKRGSTGQKKASKKGGRTSTEKSVH